MDRRQFLALLGLGAAGGAATIYDRPDAGTVSAPRAQFAADTVARPRAGQQRILWSIDTDSPRAALSFDDGPDPDFTPQILDILERHNVTATFFAMGWNAVRHSDLLREVVQRGHEIASHGWSHQNLTEIRGSETRDEIERGTWMIEERAGVQIRLFRPPYGRFDEDTVNVLGPKDMDMVVWSLTRGKLAWRDPEQVASHIAGSISPGDIVDLHDGIGRTTFNPDRPAAERLRRRRMIEIDALPDILHGIRKRKIHLATVSDLIGKSASA